MAHNENNPAIEHPSPDPGWLIADHFIKSSEYAVRRTHGSKAWLLFFTVGGEGCVKAHSNNILCSLNDITIIKPGTPHDYFSKSEENWDFYWVYFVPQPAWIELLNLPEAYPGVLTTSVAELELKARIIGAFDRMIEDCKPLDAINQQLALIAVQEILLLISQKINLKAERKLDPRISKILDSLNQDYAKEQLIEDLAKTIHLSPSRLSHLFKAEVGQTIVDTLLKIRLQNAEALLHNTSMSVAEIAEMVGFHSLNYFAKKFAFFYGLSPSSYKAHLKRGYIDADRILP